MPAGQDAADVVTQIRVVVGQQDARSRTACRRGGCDGGAGAHDRCIDIGKILLDDACVRRTVVRHDLGGVQVRAAQRYADAERRALPNRALGIDGAAVQSREIADQCEADACPLVGSRLRAAHAMKALEELRQVVGRDAHTGVAHAQLGAVTGAPKRDGDAAFKGKFQRVGEQVEENPLPHRAVDEDGLVKRGLDAKAQARTFDRRAKAARHVARQAGQVRRREHGVVAAGLEAGKLEQRIHQLQKPQRIAPGSRGQRTVSFVLRLRKLPEWSEHQREGRAKLVADVGEEYRLCPVHLREQVDAPLLFLRGARILHGRTDVRRDELEERPVFVVERTRGIDRRDERADRTCFRPARHREHHGVGHLLFGRMQKQNVDVAEREPLRAAVADDAGDGGCQNVAGVRYADGFLERAAVAVHHIDQRERNIVGILGQRRGRRRARGSRRLLHQRVRHELGKRARAACTENFCGDVVRRTEQPADLAGFVADRTVGKRVERLFEEVAAVHEEPDVVDEARLAVAEDLVGERSAHVPNLSPYLGCGPPERPGVLRESEHVQVRIVVEERHLSAPADPHGMARVEDEADRRLQTLRPRVQRPQRVIRPRVASDERRHLAFGLQK